MSIVRIGIWEESMEMMIVSSPVTTTIECLHPLRGAGHTRPGGMVMTADFQSTQESLGLMRGQSLFRAWSTGTEHIEKG